MKAKKSKGNAKVAKRIWSNPVILKTIPSPSREGYEIKIKTQEVTFLGVKDQPDFATVKITFYPKKQVIELKSLKRYFHQFRNTVVSYERFINVVYDDLMTVYKPARVRLVMKFRSRGGLQSRLVIDSDWKVRGGKEKFKDWVGK